ncbi:glycoside hydrolase family 64 protein [uncultured Nostoc sp.]|uniref:glycoside hydrolase family 64 protein n=1 Tax=uncultured Nostoc sp. TaxID=340711 RepID=UPI0035C9C594
MKFSFFNNTKQKYHSDQIYFVITGLNASHQTCHLDKNGVLIPCKVSDNDAPGHLTKNGESWCNYLHKTSDVPQIEVPQMDSGRAYISLGSPLYLKVSKDNTLIQPNTANKSDPNIDVYYDWLEFTIDGGGFHGNTTQVDQFGFPMVIELITSDKPKKAGITESRSVLFDKYSSNVPEEFKSLVQKPYRIISPFKGDFNDGGSQAKYFDNYIREMWQYYTSNKLELTMPQGKFIGKVENNVFTFTKTDSPNVKYTIHYPKSSEVFRCDGVFATGDPIQLAIQAQISAMFNRHIVKNPANKCNPSEFYKNAPANYYAQFWHLHSIDNKAYGFPFDDVCEQSSLIEHPNSRELKVTISWD